MVETYIKLKMFFEYIVPIGLLVGIGLMRVGIFLACSISEKKRRKNGCGDAGQGNSTLGRNDNPAPGSGLITGGKV